VLSHTQWSKGGPIGCGVFCLVVGSAFVLFDWLWHLPHVTRTTGTIVQSTPAVYGQTRRVITYDYMAHGIHHRGERFLRYWSPMVGRFDAGASFPVYFVDEHPEQSYAPLPPRVYPAIMFGIVWVVMGAVFIIFGKAR
jgi:hypothetical protein